MIHEHQWVRLGSATGTYSGVLWGPWHCVVCGVILDEDVPEQESAHVNPTIRLASDECMPPRATDREAEAALHPNYVDVSGGITHWSRPGWNHEENRPVSTLTFDPDCPRCQELARARAQAQL